MKLFFYILVFVLYLLVIALWIIIPGEFTLNISTSITALVSTILLVIYDKERFKILYGSLFFKKLTSALIGAFLIFSILGLVNYISFKYPFSWDLTHTKKNTLTGQSINILSGLQKKVTFHIFATKSDIAVVEALLDLYRLEKNDIEIKTVDVELRPDLVQKYRVYDSRTVVVEYDNRRFNVSGKITELAITNAIIHTSRDKNPLIYYVNNHGEHPLEEKKKGGMSEAATFLRESHFDVKETDLSVLSSIPAEVDALMIWGPKSRFLKNELKMIENFIIKGGKLLVALNPDLNKDSTPKLRALLRGFSIRINNDLVVDKKEHIKGSDGTVPLIKRFAPHAITHGFNNSVFFPLSSSVEQVSSKRKGKFTPLAFTSDYPDSWADKTGKEILKGKLRFHAENDVKGPIGVAAIWEKENKNNKKSRIMAFGNSTFLTNSYAGFGGHLTFFHNGIAWIVDEERLISFNLPAVNDEPVFISSMEIGIVFYFSVIFAPLLLFSLAVYAYKKRQLV
ncbi:MAG: GldG family protein [Halobacteriovoraceae bacterium]|nr:GldG family protein [Halobacteriovoraceae bacterium]